MDVVLWGDRHVEVDDVAERLDVDAASRDIRRDQHLVGAVLEPGEGLRPLRLRAVSVNALGLDTVGHELRCQPIGAVFGPCEDEGLRHVAALEQLDQQGAFEVLRHRIDGLRDALRWRGLALKIERDRLVQHLLRQGGNRPRHGGTEEERLPLSGRQMTQDFLNFWQKSHVEHPIGLVQHEEFKLVELGVGLPEVIQQASRGRHQHVDTAPERVFLRPHADPAEDGGAGQRRVNRHVVHALMDLRRQFAGRRQDEGTRGAPRLRHQLMEDRQQERVRLAAARHGAGQQILPLERRRDGIGLDRRRARETKFLEATLQVGVQREAGERRGCTQNRIRGMRDRKGRQFWSE